MLAERTWVVAHIKEELLLPKETTSLEVTSERDPAMRTVGDVNGWRLEIEE